MINLIKELWYKWRARVYLGKIQLAGIERLSLKAEQLEYKRKAEEYLSKYKEINKI